MKILMCGVGLGAATGQQITLLRNSCLYSTQSSVGGIAALGKVCVLSSMGRWVFLVLLDHLLQPELLHACADVPEAERPILGGGS